MMKIEEKDDLVIIDGIEIDGSIDMEQHCKKCQHNLVYYEDYDAYFCPSCNEWTEVKCEDPNCSYCPKRPEKPLP
ncbi:MULTISPECIES: hypothetical protein [Bacillaceae]|uniref:hypothetical protein n=1 Tax=Bacillaceae TaxID=186817 RepID=UPI001E35E000|nr:MULTISPECIES: hypothetical protein [Bacillaceae]MCE4048833.1 hypothetical protein [Bacillus sp. Au-Bac7]MCM3033106.1 hypothetical protein [Niallia sp. MER 6]